MSPIFLALLLWEPAPVSASIVVATLPGTLAEFAASPDAPAACAASLALMPAELAECSGWAIVSQGHSPSGACTAERSSVECAIGVQGSVLAAGDAWGNLHADACDGEEPWRVAAAACRIRSEMGSR